MASKLWKTAPTKVFKTIKPIVHWGFVPLVVFIALKQEPGLTCVQFIKRNGKNKTSRKECVNANGQFCGCARSSQSVADYQPVRRACRASDVDTTSVQRGASTTRSSSRFRATKLASSGQR
ncbi:hypothetical protein PF003_g33818 [Phytophthora fragariae]|nr:hypothetical protein PF003_g33818 [Phytophthora fragariae]